VFDGVGHGEVEFEDVGCAFTGPGCVGVAPNLGCAYAPGLLHFPHHYITWALTKIIKSWGYMSHGAASRHEVAATFRARMASFQDVLVF
jgi:hypothetical protein